MPTDVEDPGSPLPRGGVKLSALYEAHYEGPKTTLVRKCDLCTTPMRYFINNFSGLQASVAIILMMCGPLGAALLSTIVHEYVPENPTHTANNPAMWMLYYSLGCMTAGFMIFGEAMRIVMLGDATLWRIYYKRVEKREEESARASQDAATDSELPSEESSGDVSKSQASREPKSPSTRFRGALLRSLFKFRTNNVMVDGEFPRLTSWQWIRRATFLEFIAHVIIPLRWIGASLILLSFHIFNLVDMFMYTDGNFLKSAYHVRGGHYVNGMAHTTMVYMGWRLFVDVAELWRKSRARNLREDFISEVHNLDGGKQYISDAKFAFVMDGCPCTYTVPQLLALPPEYEQSTKFHSLHTYTFKKIFFGAALIVIATSAALSLACGIIFAFILNQTVQDRVRQIVE
ncbi:uncharacterized protein BXIN_1781 [Babesia sp. Xinjiang]|uniref:uncharacterized protein n=1 Tax=Babesia sp. Xinjiang TaxID=462227 RepID=UPI000A22146B|nr:uncharacterized protein BXIN_1638 [Babesia sp. Xinjiang]XP_028871441.1 uncharacterized protein BXIN_1781 [Babesia sp. Xinjiang]ORM40880.1 hypothetical protein BXIN_1638 [Babesia sp. Xinjiang]ORM40985.1 hypothetical protein BXIN_1781 [Babesia sp. Xinjiang]